MYRIHNLATAQITALPLRSLHVTIAGGLDRLVLACMHLAAAAGCLEPSFYGQLREPLPDSKMITPLDRGLREQWVVGAG